MPYPTRLNYYHLKKVEEQGEQATSGCNRAVVYIWYSARIVTDIQLNLVLHTRVTKV